MSDEVEKKAEEEKAALLKRWPVPEPAKTADEVLELLSDLAEQARQLRGYVNGQVPPGLHAQDLMAVMGRRVAAAAKLGGAEGLHAGLSAAAVHQGLLSPLQYAIAQKALKG